MATYSGGNGAFTPSTSNDNWTLQSTVAGALGKIVVIGWGGRLTTSTGYRTRWTRPTVAGTGAGTNLAYGLSQMQYNAASLLLLSTYASTQPTLAADPAGNLWAQDWNAQGGVGVIAMPLANPWWIVTGAGTASFSCRNVAGTDASGSSYHVTWEE